MAQNAVRHGLTPATVAAAKLAMAMGGVIIESMPK